MQEDANKIRSLEPFLAEHPFFKDIASDYQHLLTECASNARFGAGEMLFREGAPAEKFYLIRTGMIALEFHTPNHGAITLQTLRDGDVVGWSWLIAPYTWHFDARAGEATRVIALDAACLRRKCQADPHLGYILMTKVAGLLANRLMAVRLQLAEVYDDSLV